MASTSSSSRRTSRPRTTGSRGCTFCARVSSMTTSAGDPTSSTPAGQHSAWVESALQAWGTTDRDDPFPLFAEVRGLGPVHHVTLADGHDAWLVVGHDEARLVLNDPRVSKDMQRRARPGRWGGGRGPPWARVRSAHARRGPARSHPVASARVLRLLPAQGRGSATTSTEHRGRPPRRSGRWRPR